MLHLLYIFNNDCEMAIANQIPHYTPPRNIIRMREDLAFLMSYIAQKEGYILCTEKPSKAFLESIKQWQLPVQYITYEELETFKDKSNLRFIPWGIAPNIQALMDKRQIKAWNMAWSDDLREKMSRKITISCIERWNSLTHTNPYPVPQLAYQCSEINHCIANRKAVIKAPWSSSGKGILFVENTLTSKQEEWIRGILHKQNYVLIESYWDKICDFAFEFEITAPTSVGYLGISLFETNATGVYSGNQINTQKNITDRLNRYITRDQLQKARDHITAIITQLIAPYYKGYLGIDMLIAKDVKGNYQVVPFVEINFRCNMGILSLRLAQFIHKEASGFFRIQSFSSAENANLYFTEKSSDIVWDTEGKLQKGAIALTPICKDTRFVAELVVF